MRSRASPGSPRRHGGFKPEHWQQKVLLWFPPEIEWARAICPVCLHSAGDRDAQAEHTHESVGWHAIRCLEERHAKDPNFGTEEFDGTLIAGFKPPDEQVPRPLTEEENADRIRRNEAEWRDQGRRMEAYNAWQQAGRPAEWSPYDRSVRDGSRVGVPAGKPLPSPASASASASTQLTSRAFHRAGLHSSPEPPASRRGQSPECGSPRGRRRSASGESPGGGWNGRAATAVVDRHHRSRLPAQARSPTGWPSAPGSSGSSGRQPSGSSPVGPPPDGLQISCHV